MERTIRREEREDAKLIQRMLFLHLIIIELVIALLMAIAW
jgi:hypothetical protein